MLRGSAHRGRFRGGRLAPLVWRETRAYRARLTSANMRWTVGFHSPPWKGFTSESPVSSMHPFIQERVRPVHIGVRTYVFCVMS